MLSAHDRPGTLTHSALRAFGGNDGYIILLIFFFLVGSLSGYRTQAAAVGVPKPGCCTTREPPYAILQMRKQARRLSNLSKEVVGLMTSPPT